MANDHFMFAPEAEWGTWVAPNHAYGVRSASLGPAQPLMDPEETGFGRGARIGERGELGVGGDVSSTFHPIELPLLIASVFGYRSSAGASDGFLTKLLPDDEVVQKSFSIQQRYAATRAFSFKGAKVNSIDITAATKAFAEVGIGFVGKDIARNGGTWIGDGGAGPAVVDPVPYPASMPASFKFYEAVVRLGGMASLVANEIVVLGGSQRKDFDNIGFNMTLGLGEDGYGVNLGDRTRQSIDEGVRGVTTRFDPRWDLDPEFWDAWMAGTPAIVELYFRGGLLGASAPAAGTNEVQTLTITGSPTGGTFTLTFNGKTTAAIAYNAGPAAVQAALLALNVFDTGDIVAAGTALPAGSITLTFGGQYAGQNVPMISGTSSLTGGTTPAVAIAETTPGAGGENNRFEVKITMPYVQYDDANPPEIARSYGLRRSTVTGTAKVHETIGYDVGVTIKSTEEIAAILA